MKLIILTSSIFYFLGLQLTNQVEINQKSLNDSVQIPMHTQKELILPEQDIQQLPQLDTTEKEDISTNGSNENTAPWVPLKENMEID